MANLDLYLEAERRGILPPDKAALLNEARSRGLVPGAPGMPQDQMPEPRMTTGNKCCSLSDPRLKRLAPQVSPPLAPRLAPQVLLGAQG